MRKLTIAALVAGQMLAAAQPAFAADFAEAREQRPGTFAGFRLRVPLDGAVRHRQVRAGLAIAPMLESRTVGGESRLRIGEGLEFGFNGRGPAQFSLAGMPVNRLAQSGTGPNGQRLGVSTIGWIAIGVGAAVVIVVGATAICLSDSDCNPSE